MHALMMRVLILPAKTPRKLAAAQEILTAMMMIDAQRMCARKATAVRAPQQQPPRATAPRRPAVTAAHAPALALNAGNISMRRVTMAAARRTTALLTASASPNAHLWMGKSARAAHGLNKIKAINNVNIKMERRIDQRVRKGSIKAGTN